jgi:hypothetical protein
MIPAVQVPTDLFFEEVDNEDNIDDILDNSTEVLAQDPWSKEESKLQHLFNMMVAHQFSLVYIIANGSKEKPLSSDAFLNSNKFPDLNLPYNKILFSMLKKSIEMQMTPYFHGPSGGPESISNRKERHLCMKLFNSRIYPPSTEHFVSVRTSQDQCIASELVRLLVPVEIFRPSVSFSEFVNVNCCKRTEVHELVFRKVWDIDGRLEIMFVRRRCKNCSDREWLATRKDNASDRYFSEISPEFITQQPKFLQELLKYRFTKRSGISYRLLELIIGLGGSCQIQPIARFIQGIYSHISISLLIRSF